MSIAVSRTAGRPVRIRDIKPWRCFDPKKAVRYRDQMRAGETFPPIYLERLPSGSAYRYAIVDGCHRTRAAKRLGESAIRAVILITPYKPRRAA